MNAPGPASHLATVAPQFASALGTLSSLLDASRSEVRSLTPGKRLILYMVEGKGFEASSLEIPMI